MIGFSGQQDSEMLEPLAPNNPMSLGTVATVVLL